MSGRAILEEIKEAAQQWSSYRRRGRRAWPSTSLLGRVVELGAQGAAARSNKTPDPPLVDVSWEVSCFDRAYKNLSEYDQRVLELMYVERGSPKRKAHHNNCSVATLYNRRTDALINMIPDWIGLTKDKFLEK